MHRLDCLSALSILIKLLAQRYSQNLFKGNHTDTNPAYQSCRNAGVVLQKILYGQRLKHLISTPYFAIIFSQI